MKWFRMDLLMRDFDDSIVSETDEEIYMPSSSSTDDEDVALADVIATRMWIYSGRTNSLNGAPGSIA